MCQSLTAHTHCVRQNRDYITLNTQGSCDMKQQQSLIIFIVSFSAVSESFQVRHGGSFRALHENVVPAKMSLRSKVKKMSGSMPSPP